MYVGTSCNTTPTAAAVHIYMHGLRSVDWVNNDRYVLTQVFEICILVYAPCSGVTAIFDC